MNKTAAAIVSLAGFLLVFGGVGGIEHSETNEQLLSSTVVAVLGLLAMYAGYLGNRNSELEYYDYSDR
jgi:uncharacterized membrane protein